MALFDVRAQIRRYAHEMGMLQFLPGGFLDRAPFINHSLLLALSILAGPIIGLGRQMRNLRPVGSDPTFIPLRVRVHLTLALPLAPGLYPINCRAGASTANLEQNRFGKRSACPTIGIDVTRSGSDSRSP